MHRASSMLGRLLDFLFPPKCLGCGRHGFYLCSPCSARLAPARETGIPGVLGAFSYRDTLIKTCIHDLKYRHRTQGARLLSRLAGDVLISHLDERMETDAGTRIVLVPIPASTQHGRARGFNQSLVIAKALKKTLPFEHISIQNALQKTKQALPQTKMQNREARLRNMEQIFSFGAETNPRTMYICVDDVVTTGATLSAARKALEMAGAKRSIGFALAHAPLEK